MLLYALLFMALITAIGIFVSIVIINELKLTSTAVDATLAYYAAESGIEKGLHTVKMNRGKGGVTLGATVTEIQGYNASDFDNRAKYDNEGTNQISGTIDDSLKKDEYVQIDFYNVDEPLVNSGIRRVKVSGTSVNGEAWAEVSWTGWKSDGVWFSEPSAKKFIGPTDLADGLDFELSMGTVPIIDVVGYRIRIKALFGDIEDLVVTPLDENRVEKEEPSSQVVVKSVGNKGKFKQSLTAIVPWKVPLHGLYDYVLFSEEALAKTIIVGREIYTSGAIQVENNLSSPCTGCPHPSYGTCIDWLAMCCAEFSSCTVDPNTGNCKLDSTSTHWVLPIPDYIPPAEEYYLSIRARYSTAGDSMRLFTGSTCKEIADQGTTDWFSCTIPDDDFGTLSNNSLKFERMTGNTGDIDVDWYQLSTYKIFDDCENITACSVPSPDCGDCICNDDEICASGADDIVCPDSGADCQRPACGDAGNNLPGCQMVWEPDNSTELNCPGDICCSGDCFDPDTVCTDNNCGPDPCKVYSCDNINTCSVACNFVRDKDGDAFPGDCSMTSDSCCPSGCDDTNDADCVGPPDKEYLRYVAYDEDGINLASLPPSGDPGKSMREIPVWQSQRTGTTYLRDVWLADLNNIWAVGDGGTILYSDDGGATWGSQTSNTSESLRGIFGLNSSSIWAVGANGAIVYYNGSSWTALPTFTTSRLNDIWVYDINNVWVVADEIGAGDGIVWHCDSSCTDASANWVQQSVASLNQHLNGIWGLDSNNIWASGDAGKIVYYTSGSWTEQTSGAAGNLYGISGTDSNNIWAVGAGGAIAYSNDGTNGTSWTSQDWSMGGIIYSVSAYYENGNPTAIIGATSGFALYYDGAVWRNQTTGVGNVLRGIFAYDHNNIWAVGNSEAIIYGNAPVDPEVMNIGYDFNQSWYSRGYTQNQTLPAGQYIAKFYVTDKNNVGGKNTKFIVSFGYCDDFGGDGTSCNEDPSDYHVLLTSPQTTFSKSFSVPDWYNDIVIGTLAADTPITCSAAAPCRLWGRIYDDGSDNSTQYFTVGVGGPDTASGAVNNSYIDIPGP